jgi:hypothetical protein
MLNEETYQKLRDKYGTIAEVDADDGRTLAIKKPSADSFRAFVVKLTKDGTNKEAAIRDMVRENAVYPAKQDGTPDVDAIDALIEEYPGLPMALGGAVNDMSGTSAEVRIRKN